jgi:hypothetical protein
VDRKERLTGDMLRVTVQRYCSYDAEQRYDFVMRMVRFPCSSGADNCLHVNRFFTAIS